LFSSGSRASPKLSPSRSLGVLAILKRSLHPADSSPSVYPSISVSRFVQSASQDVSTL
jgi:hypothetical protein